MPTAMLLSTEPRERKEAVVERPKHFQAKQVYKTQAVNSTATIQSM